MQRGISRYLVVPLIALALAGCRFDDEEREPWRAEAEEQCLASRVVQPAAYLEPGEAVNGKGTCGMTKPFKVAAVSGGFVEFKPKATLSCPLVANVEAWFHEAIQPAAMAWYGSPVSEIKQISAYSCRTMNGQPGASISEHAFGNALDIASFRFADGREVEFKSGWKGGPEERGFLRAVHAAACERFSTVLAPGADMFHYDHIHVDLARRSSGVNVCKPAPMTLPAPAPRLPDVPVAQAPSPYPPVRPAPQIAAGPAASPSTSPWARQGPPPAQRPVQAPMTVEREPMRAAGPPLVLGNQAPPTQSFATQLPLADRVRQSLGSPVPAQRPLPPPAQQPGYQNPYGLMPPERIPNARLGADPVVTGSIAAPDKKEKSARADKLEASLMSPHSLAEQRPGSEAASVFDRR